MLHTRWVQHLEKKKRKKLVIRSILASRTASSPFFETLEPFTRVSTKHGKPFMRLGRSFTRQQRFKGLKMQTFENEV